VDPAELEPFGDGSFWTLILAVTSDIIKYLEIHMSLYVQMEFSNHFTIFDTICFEEYALHRMNGSDACKSDCWC
jgi:hypothetical protein